MAIADTGASSHYFMPSAPVINVDQLAPTISIGTTTRQGQHSSAKAAINLTTLPAGKSRLSHVMPSTFTNNLLSIGTLCNAECTVIFTRFWVTIRDQDGNTILQGPREKQGSRLWRVDLRAHDNPMCPPGHKYCHHPHAGTCPIRSSHSLAHTTGVAATVTTPTAAPPHPTSTPTLTPTIHLTSSPAPNTITCTPTMHLMAHRPPLHQLHAMDLPSIYHATAGSPVKSTWLVAIKAGNYSSWPGLS